MGGGGCFALFCFVGHWGVLYWSLHLRVGDNGKPLEFGQFGFRLVEVGARMPRLAARAGRPWGSQVMGSARGNAMFYRRHHSSYKYTSRPSESAEGRWQELFLFFLFPAAPSCRGNECFCFFSPLHLFYGFSKIKITKIKKNRNIWK